MINYFLLILHPSLVDFLLMKLLKLVAEIQAKVDCLFVVLRLVSSVRKNRALFYDDQLFVLWVVLYYRSLSKNETLLESLNKILFGLSGRFG